MEIQHLYSIVVASFICSFCILNVHAETTPEPSTTPVPAVETTTDQSSSAAPSTQPSTVSSDSPSATASTTEGTTGTDGSTTPNVTTIGGISGTGTTTQSSQETPTSDTPTSGVSTTDGGTESTTQGNTGTGTPGTGSTTLPSAGTSDDASGSTSGAEVTASSTPVVTVPIADTTTAGPSSTPTETTEEETTAAPTSTAAAVTTQSPLTTKYPSVGADIDIATYTLPLPFTGEDDNPATWCNDSYLLQELTGKLNSTVGYMDTNSAGAKTFNVVYRAKTLRNSHPNNTLQGIQTALDTESHCYNNTANMFDKAITDFAALTTDYCSAEYICPLGYKCQTRNSLPVCTSLCEDMACENDGVCNVIVEKGSANAVCKCVDTYESIYHGDKCEMSRMNPERVAAIVGGVLGAVCFILLVALYCMCYRKRGEKGKKYNLAGVYNETYDHASLDMKNM